MGALHIRIPADMHMHIMRTTIELSDNLLARAKKLMAKRKLTLRALVEEGLRRVLDEEQAESRRFELEDASFKGPRGFAEGMSEQDLARVLRETNEGRPLS